MMWSEPVFLEEKKMHIFFIDCPTLDMKNHKEAQLLLMGLLISDMVIYLLDLEKHKLTDFVFQYDQMQRILGLHKIEKELGYLPEIIPLDTKNPKNDQSSKAHPPLE